jgi:predicted DNA-binding transcriptional regulator YafY
MKRKYVCIFVDKGTFVRYDREKKGAAKMNGLLLRSKEEKLPIEIMYMAADNTITKRRIIVTGMDEKYIKAYCLTRKQTRTFKRESILAAAKPRKWREANYA